MVWGKYSGTVQDSLERLNIFSIQLRSSFSIIFAIKFWNNRAKPQNSNTRPHSTIIRRTSPHTIATTIITVEILFLTQLKQLFLREGKLRIALQKWLVVWQVLRCQSQWEILPWAVWKQNEGWNLLGSMAKQAGREIHGLYCKNLMSNRVLRKEF